MKATDLMIGDYVRYIGSGYCDVKNGDIIKVESVQGRYIGVGNNAMADDELFEPIPLTSEILNKNRFETNGKAIYAAYCPEDKHANLEISEHYCYDNEKTDGGFYWTINCCEYDIIRLRYVHELQHALRLCRIEKEIVL